MSFLTPLGLLGLLGIIILIIIYIIKPNYQQKIISSTFVWKLSLKFRKKKLPTSRLRDIILIICQILIVTACSLILAHPVKILKVVSDKPDVIAIIDASASMRANYDGVTRYRRAVDATRALAEKTLDSDGRVSVIVADADPSFLLQNFGSDRREDVKNSLDGLLSDPVCGYGISDIESSVKMCETIIDENPNAQIYIYTDKEYYDVPDGINVCYTDVRRDGEWNAAILDVYTEKAEGYYNLIVKVACYGKQAELDLSVQVTGANKSYIADGETSEDITLAATAVCEDNLTTTVVFTYAGVSETEDGEKTQVVNLSEDERFFNYEKISVDIVERSGNGNGAKNKDSFTEDDHFEVYGGSRAPLIIQYYSVQNNASSLTSFVSSILLVLQSLYEEDWDITIDEIKKGDPVIEGYDYYIFEHTMPSELPKDGFVFLIDPESVPVGADFTLGNVYEWRTDQFLALGEDGDGSPILEGVTPGDILIRRYTRITNYGAYQCLLSTVDGYPALLYRETETTKTAVLAFDYRYSWLPILKDFPILMNNIFDHNFPAALSKHVYSVDDTVTMRAMGKTIEFKGVGSDVRTFTEFPATTKVTIPGTYTVSQKTVFGKELTDNFYVKIPSAESNIFMVEDSIVNPFQTYNRDDFYRDLLLYVAGALVALLFVEWLLQIKDNF